MFFHICRSILHLLQHQCSDSVSPYFGENFYLYWLDSYCPFNPPTCFLSFTKLNSLTSIKAFHYLLCRGSLYVTNLIKAWPSPGSQAVATGHREGRGGQGSSGGIYTLAHNPTGFYWNLKIKSYKTSKFEKYQ